MEKKISHVEIYYEDESMERISSEKPIDKKLTKKQVEFIIDECLTTIDNFRRYDAPVKKVTIDNYKQLVRDHTDMTNEHFNMLVSILDTIK